MNKILFLILCGLSLNSNVLFSMDKGKRPLSKGAATVSRYALSQKNSYNSGNSDEAGPSTSESVDITGNFKVVNITLDYSTASKEAHFLHFKALYGSGTSFSYPNFGTELSPSELADHREHYRRAYFMAFGEPSLDSNDVVDPRRQREIKALMLSDNDSSLEQRRKFNLEIARKRLKFWQKIFKRETKESVEKFKMLLLPSAPMSSQNLEAWRRFVPNGLYLSRGDLSPEGSFNSNNSEIQDEV